MKLRIKKQGQYYYVQVKLSIFFYWLESWKTVSLYPRSNEYDYTSYGTP